MEEIEVPTEHLHEQLQEKALEAEENWILKVALTAAILAVFAAITSLLAGHYSNEAMIEQLKASDQWAFYQAKGIKSAILETRMELTRDMGKEVNPKDQEKVKQYKEEQKEIQKTAEEKQEQSKTYLNVHNTLAKGVTLFQVAIAICAISALTKRKPLWYGSMVLGLAGIVVLGLGIF